MFCYALLTDDLIATAVVATTEPVALPTGGIALDDYTPEVVGMRWTGSGWAPGDTRPAPLTQLDFLRRFTAAERIAIRGSADPVVIDFLHLLSLAREIRLDDPDTLAGVGYLEQAGLVVAGRAAEILAG